MTSRKLTIRLYFIGVKMVRLAYGVAGLLFSRALVSSPDKEVDVNQHKSYPAILLLVSCPTAYLGPHDRNFLVRFNYEFFLRGATERNTC